MEIRTIASQTHGRYLVEGDRSDRVVVGFHGYAESAGHCLDQLRLIPGAGEWTLVAVQALHPFYQSRSGEVVASWMTSQDRELAIADNVDYIRRIIDSLWKPATMVFLGFSQGAAMAYRAGALVAGASGVIALGGDAPPDVTGGLPPVLIGRGRSDPWYTPEKLEKDLRFLEGRTEVTVFEFDGAHEWTDEFRSAAGEFLRSRI